jgi:thiamine biosynthesis protein ThiS
MQVQINGETRQLSHNQIALAELVRELALAPQRIAVEVNKRIVRRDEWEQTAINDGDQIEIVHFVGGGAGPDRREWRIQAFCFYSSRCRVIPT